MSLTGFGFGCDAGHRPGLKSSMTLSVEPLRLYTSDPRPANHNVPEASDHFLGSILLPRLYDLMNQQFSNLNLPESNSKLSSPTSCSAAAQLPYYIMRLLNSH